MEWEKHYILINYPPEIKTIVGLIALRYGQVDRLICYALENMCGNEKRKELIGIFRDDQLTLGGWINWAKGEKIKKKYNLDDAWLDKLISHLNILSKKRNAIFHDALLQNEAENFVWMSGTKSEKREHRPFKMDEMEETLKDLDNFNSFILESERL